MKHMRHLICLSFAFFTIIIGSQVAKAEPLRIGYMVWVGIGPLFVAREKGFFANEGVEVELIDMAVHEASYAGLFAGQVDAIVAVNRR